MFSISPDEPELSCPSCHRQMIAMRSYQQAMDDGNGIGFDSPLLIGSGRNSMVNPFAILELFGNMLDGILNIGRNKKGARLCREILPRYPKSQICPECLYVYRK